MGGSDARAAGKGKGKGVDLNIVGPVQTGTSDAAGVAFQSDTLNDVRQLAARGWADLPALGNDAIMLDPSKISLAMEYEVRAYFVGEETRYRNSVGFNTQAGGIDSGDPLLMFPNASSRRDGYRVVDTPVGGRRTANKPLLPGDFVDMGTLGAGTDLNFFLLADGSTKPRDVYSSETGLNPNQNPYMTAFAYTDGDSSYLVLGFEDGVGRGRSDFTDVVIALDIGDINIAALTATPEPATLLTLGSLIGVVGFARHRRRRVAEGKARRN